MSIQRYGIRIGALAGAFVLGGCLISEEPLLDAKTGRAAPLASGFYEACEYDGEGGDPDCRRMDIRRTDEALYEFRTEDEDDLTFVRFRRIARGAWLTQLIGEDEEDYSYFLGETAGDDFVLVWILCDVIPEDVRAEYSARGEMEVDEGKYGSTCVAKTLHAAIAGAKAFRTVIAPEPRPRTVLRKLSDAEE